MNIEVAMADMVLSNIANWLKSTIVRLGRENLSRYSEEWRQHYARQDLLADARRLFGDKRNPGQGGNLLLRNDALVLNPALARKVLTAPFGTAEYHAQLRSFLDINGLKPQFVHDGRQYWALVRQDSALPKTVEIPAFSPAKLTQDAMHSSDLVTRPPSKEPPAYEPFATAVSAEPQVRGKQFGTGEPVRSESIASPRRVTMPNAEGAFRRGAATP